MCTTRPEEYGKVNHHECFSFAGLLKIRPRERQAKVINKDMARQRGPKNKNSLQHKDKGTILGRYDD